MAIEKITEFAKSGNKNTDDLDLETGFIPSRKPARQWFNWLFNTLTLKINEIIDGKLDVSKRGVANGVASLDENKKVPVVELPAASTTTAGILKLVNDLTTGGTDKGLTAEQGKNILDMFASNLSANGYQKIPNPTDPTKPFIIQWMVGNSDANGVLVLSNPMPFQVGPIGGMANEGSPGGWGSDRVTVWAFDLGSSDKNQSLARVRDIRGSSGPAASIGISGRILVWGC